MRPFRALRPIISIDPDVLSGTPVFCGTEVPVQWLVDHFEAGGRVDRFLQDHADVARGQVEMLLDVVRKALERSLGSPR